MKNRIVISPYDPQWPLQFGQLGMPLRAALGDLALRIDHIGSTSVPGLAANDVIDVQITVAALDRRALMASLSSLGYHFWDMDTCDHVPPGRTDTAWQWSKLYFSEPPGQRPTHIHVRQAGRPNQRYALLFRDYLRADPSVAAAYAQIKEALARLHPEDFDAYYEVKDPVCDLVMAAAERWAASVGYAPGEPDL
jgi:GrpB-like predicted nucleotidyltransferase (UPF0157 family)